MEFLFLAFERPDVDRIMNLLSCFPALRGCTSNCGVLVTERAKPLSPVPSRTFIKYTRYVLLYTAKQSYVTRSNSEKCLKKKRLGECLKCKQTK